MRQVGNSKALCTGAPNMGNILSTTASLAWHSGKATSYAKQYTNTQAVVLIHKLK